MKVRLRFARSLTRAALGVSASGLFAALPAQSRVAPAPRIMVPVFRSSEKALGVEAANAVRNKLEGDVSPRSLAVIPKKDIDTTLILSGYSTTEPLNANDANALAKQIRADEYVDALASKTATGYRIDARLILARDANVSQPLPSATGAKLDDVASQVSRNLREARKQIDDEKACYFASRQGKNDEAIKAANSAIKNYPQSTMARLCLLGVYQSRKAAGDSALVLKTAEDVIAIDPRSRPALTAVSPIYLARGDTNKYVGSLNQMVVADPTNATLVNRIVNDLGAIGRAKDAIEPVKIALDANPGEPGLTRTAWLLYLAASQYKNALAMGEELIKVDTAAFDTTFVIRMAGAATADSQPQKTVEWLSRGTQRFPNNASLWMVRGQQERKLGQTQQAATSFRKALALDPKINNGQLLLAQSFLETNQPDSAVDVIRAAAATADAGQKSTLGTFLLKIGNDAYKLGMISKGHADSTKDAGDGAKARADYAKAIRLLAFSDSLSPSLNAKFLIGVSAFYAGALAATDSPKNKSCDLAKEAQADFVMAQVNVPAGGKDNPGAAAQLMQALTQYSPVVENQVKQFCKNGGKGAGK